MTRDWKTGGPISQGCQTYYCWKDLILKDEFGITEEDWNTVIQQTVTHIRDWGNQTISDRVACMVDLLLPPLEILWQGKEGKNDELSFYSFRWLPCRSLPGATVADHALTASAIAYCLGYDNGFRSEDKTLNKLRLSALTATWKDDGLGDIYDAVWSELSPIEPKPDGDVCEQIVHAAKTVASERSCIDSQKKVRYASTKTVC